MYYGGVARAPLADRTVIFLALLATSCSGNLNPIRPRPLGQDASVLADSSVGQDASISPDSSVPVVCPDLLIGYATMSNKGGEPDGSVPPMPLLDGGVTGGAAGPIVVVDATNSDALSEFSTYGDRQDGGAAHHHHQRDDHDSAHRRTAETPAASRSAYRRTRPSSAPTPARASSAADWR